MSAAIVKMERIYTLGTHLAGVLLLLLTPTEMENLFTVFCSLLVSQTLVKMFRKERLLNLMRRNKTTR